MSLPTLEPLDRATISFTGTYIEILFKDNDRTSTQFKQMVSFQAKRPIKFIFQSKDSTKVEWWLDGVNYNPLGAAITVASTSGFNEHHHLPDGSLGCDYGPAFVTHTFGVSYIERWVSGNSTLHRDDGGPALTEIDYGIPQKESWTKFAGTLGIVVTGDKDVTGTVIKRREQDWRVRGVCHRPDSWAKQLDLSCFERFEQIPPMGIMRTLFCGTRELRWYDEQERFHRPDGPARIVMRNLTEIEKDGKMSTWRCDSWSGEWYIHGKEIPSYDIIKWSKKNHIPMWDEPCYDHSAFRSDDGELCFITDFAGQMK